MKSYTALYGRAGKWWEITVPQLPFGRTTQVRRRRHIAAVAKDLISVVTGENCANIEVLLAVRRGEQPSSKFGRIIKPLSRIAKKARSAISSGRKAS